MLVFAQMLVAFLRVASTGPPAPPLDDSVCGFLVGHYHDMRRHGRFAALSKRTPEQPTACMASLLRILATRCQDSGEGRFAVYAGCEESLCREVVMRAVGLSPDTAQCRTLLLGLPPVRCSAEYLWALLLERVDLPTLGPLREALDLSQLPEAGLPRMDEATLAQVSLPTRSYLWSRGLVTGVFGRPLCPEDEPGSLWDADAAAQAWPPDVREPIALTCLRLHTFFEDIGTPRRALATTLRALIVAPPAGPAEAAVLQELSKLGCHVRGSPEHALLEEAAAILARAGRAPSIACQP